MGSADFEGCRVILCDPERVQLAQSYGVYSTRSERSCEPWSSCDTDVSV